MKRAFGHPLLWAALAFLALPYVMPGANPFALHMGFVDLATTILIFSLLALGFNLLFGHTGELSFGHAMFFTLGAYTTSLYTKGFSLALFGRTFQHAPANNLLVALLLSLAIVCVWAFLLARLIVPRSSGIYFSMITLAFAQVIFFVTYKWGEFTGGEDGIQAVARPVLPGFPPDFLADPVHFYYFTATMVFAAIAVLWWVIHSPFGSVCHALRENRQRARFLGYDVTKYRINAFFISTLFPAVGGWLWAYYQQAINPDAGSVEYSGRVVMMSLLGGIQTFFGPMLGSLVYWELQNNISHYTKYWEASIGVVFAFFVLAAPRGIWGGIEDIQHYGFANAFRRILSRRARFESERAEELPSLVEEHEQAQAKSGSP